MIVFMMLHLMKQQLFLLMEFLEKQVEENSTPQAVTITITDNESAPTVTLAIIVY